MRWILLLLLVGQATAATEQGCGCFSFPPDATMACDGGRWVVRSDLAKEVLVLPFPCYGPST